MEGRPRRNLSPIATTVLAGLVLVSGAIAASTFVGSARPGWALAWTDGVVEVIGVDAVGPARRAGLEVGDAVIRMDPGSVTADSLPALSQGEFDQADLVKSGDVDAYLKEGVIRNGVKIMRPPTAAELAVGSALGVILAVIGLGLGWVVAGRADPRFSMPMVAASVAIAGPLLTATEIQFGSGIGVVAAAVAGQATALPLLAETIGWRSDGRRATAAAIVAGLTALAALVWIGLAYGSGRSLDPRIALVIVPVGVGLVCLARLVRARVKSPAQGDTQAMAVIGIAAIGPLAAWAAVLLSIGPVPNPVVIAVAFGAIGVLAWLLGRRREAAAIASIAERDAVIAAMESERARIAADIHDDALQDLAGLIHLLEARGDDVHAATVREVATRLRALCYDLRLPILADFGAGPALEWLVNRAASSDVSVTLDRVEAGRPPPDVELAFFRVAQEALSNAVAHGRSPISVRYHAEPSRASLEVRDSGPGIPSSVLERASSSGRLGLINMRQRAEQVRGTIDISAVTEGGTRVRLSWDATP